MSLLQLGRNKELEHLLSSGYQVKFKNGIVFVENIPYVNSKKEVCYGTLIDSRVNMEGNNIVKPKDHTMHFIGGIPCDSNGVELQSIINNKKSTKVNGVDVNCYLSRKPSDGYKDYEHKIMTYIGLISAPAKGMIPSADARVEIEFNEPTENSIFKYPETNSIRNNTQVLNKKLSEQKIAIIGVGGTGSYILDFISKTEVSEIHLFDMDKIGNHNAFRMPGAMKKEELEEAQYKVNYLSEKYSEMRDNIFPHQEYITEANLDLLEAFDFIFICIDGGESKTDIIKYLTSENKSFIDTGVGLLERENRIFGMLKLVLCNSNYGKIEKHLSNTDNNENVYDSNIQIAELNALLASLAVMKWKQTLEYYEDNYRQNVYIFDIGTGKIAYE